MFKSKLFGTTWRIVIYLCYDVEYDIVVSGNALTDNSTLLDFAGQLVYSYVLPKPIGQSL